jgi:hypothetical protein
MRAGQLADGHPALAVAADRRERLQDFGRSFSTMSRTTRWFFS